MTLDTTTLLPVLQSAIEGLRRKAPGLSSIERRKLQSLEMNLKALRDREFTERALRLRAEFDAETARAACLSQTLAETLAQTRQRVAMLQMAVIQSRCLLHAAQGAASRQKTTCSIQPFPRAFGAGGRHALQDTARKRAILVKDINHKTRVG